MTLKILLLGQLIVLLGALMMLVDTVFDFGGSVYVKVVGVVVYSGVTIALVGLVMMAVELVNR